MEADDPTTASTETMDVDGLLKLLARIEDGTVEVICRDLTAPSPLSHAIIGARPYAFLDDGDAEGRRTRSISTQRLMEPQDAADLGRLDPDAIERVIAEAQPEIGNHDELHDTLVVHGYLTQPEVEPWKALLARLREERRVLFHEGLWVAVERSAEFERAKNGDIEALAEILRSRLELVGPVDGSRRSPSPSTCRSREVRAALLALESQGSIMRGRFRGNVEEWCDRRLLIRIHRYTRDRQRKGRCRPCRLRSSCAFLFRWQRVAMEGSDDRREGEAGLLAVLQELEGFAVPAGAWERDILPLRGQELPAAGTRQALRRRAHRLVSAGRADRQRARPRRGAGAQHADHARGSARRCAHWQKPRRRRRTRMTGSPPGRRRSSRASPPTAPRSSATSSTTPACCAPRSNRASASWSAAAA